MANLLITEFSGIDAARGSAPVQVAGGVTAAQTVAIGVASVQSSAVNANTRLVRLFAEADCTVSIGANPTATVTNHIPLAADQFDYVWVATSDKIAVIQRTVA